MNVDNYQKPAWATFCKVLGVISLLGFSIMALVLMEDHKDKEAFALFGIGIGSFINMFFIAWCVETFADIRHYARDTAITSRLLLRGRDSNNKAQAEAEDTKPNAPQAQ